MSISVLPNKPNSAGSNRPAMLNSLPFRTAATARLTERSQRGTGVSSVEPRYSVVLDEVLLVEIYRSAALFSF
jgi:hypothetical protein